MTIDGLLTFLALLVAVFALSTRAQRLNLRLKLRVWHVVVALLGGIAVHMLELPEVLAKLPHIPEPKQWFMDPKEIAYLVVLAVSALVGLHMWCSPLPKGKVYQLRLVVDELAGRGQYEDIVVLLKTHLRRLLSLSRSKSLSQRLRSWLLPAPEGMEEVLARLAERLVAERTGGAKPLNAEVPGVKVPVPLKKRLAGLRKHLAQLIPEEKSLSSEVGLLLQGSILRPACVRLMAAADPGLALAVLASDARERFEFADAYFRELLENRESVLYWEVRNNQNLSAAHRYYLPETNRTLHFLLSDAKVAESLGVWKPIGDAVIAELQRRGKASERDAYNDELGEYQERDQWRCPIFVGVRFFDIMVSEAIDQNIEWHMWLYYFYSFADAICDNYRPDPARVDLDAEFPTVYSFLLYEMVTTLRDWIRKIEELPVDQANVILQGEEADHENGNPVKSAILALGRCISVIFSCPRIPDRFKNYMVSIALNLYFDLDANPKTKRYASALRSALLSGGFRMGSRLAPDYLGPLLRALIVNDNIPHDHDRVEALARSVFDVIRGQGDVGALSPYVRAEPHERGILLVTDSPRSSILLER